MKCKEQTLTFYPDVHKEKTMTEVFPETRLEFEASGDDAVAGAPAAFTIEDSESYIVEFDDVAHEIVATSGAISNDLFSISVTGGEMAVSIAQAGSHTVRVIACTTRVCQLPEEYIPGGAGGASLEELKANGQIGYMVQGYLLPETTVAIDPHTGSGALLDIINVSEGSTYTVKWNGTDYSCIGQAFDFAGLPVVGLGNIGAVTGGDSTDEPFVLVFLTDVQAAVVGCGIPVQSLDGSTSATLSIMGETVIPIDTKWLPAPVVLYVDDEQYLYAEPFDGDTNKRITCSELRTIWFSASRVLVGRLEIGDDDSVTESYETALGFIEDGGIGGILNYNGIPKYYTAEYIPS